MLTKMKNDTITPKAIHPIHSFSSNSDSFVNASKDSWEDLLNDKTLFIAF